MKPIKLKPHQGREKAPESQGRKGRKALFGLVPTVATLLGYVVLIPHVTPTISDPTDSDNPFSSSLTITNNSVYPLDSVGVFIKLGTVCAHGSSCPEKTHFPNPHRYDGREAYNNFRRSDWSEHYLAIDDRFTVALNDVFDQTPNQTTEYADFAVVIRYEIPVIHWKVEKMYPCYTRTQSNGKLYWYWG